MATAAVAVLPPPSYTTTPETRANNTSLSKTWLEITLGVSKDRFPFVGCKDCDLRGNINLEFIEKLGAGTKGDDLEKSLSLVNLIKEMLSFDERAFACELLEAHLLFSKEGE